jgi:hypothetical protein
VARHEAVCQLLELQAQIEAHIRVMTEGCPTHDIHTYTRGLH